MSPGKEADLTEMLLTQTTPSDYENLCRLDILGLKDHPTSDQSNVYQEFKEQLVRTPDGWYETGLLWKGNHPPLANNKEGSIKRLESLETEIKPLETEIKPLEAEIKPLDAETKSLQTVETSHAKEQLGVKPGETSLLGVSWDKEKDTIKVNFPD
jgi:uncharacterized protein (UPF0335 family)